MTPQPPVFNIDTLKQREQAYHARVAEEPCDTGARVGLAWCLIVRALHRAGEETILADLLLATEGLDEQHGSRLRAIIAENVHPESDARHLLKSSLQQTVTVLHLSSDPREQSDIEKLRALVKLSGGGQEVSESEKEAARILAELTQAILYD